MGRHEKQIDWDLVDEMLEAENTGISIASEFNMHADTFYRKVQEEFNIGFTDYAQSKRAKGEDNIKLAQYRKAIGASKKGDTTMLTYLGKVRLKQVEANMTMQVEPKTEEQLDAVMNMISQFHLERKSSTSVVSNEASIS